MPAIPRSLNLCESSFFLKTYFSLTFHSYEDNLFRFVGIRTGIKLLGRWGEVLCLTFIHYH